jgi:hypothetical protein
MAASVDEQGYSLEKRSSRSISFKRRFLPTAGKVIGLVIFPIGILVWPFYRQEESFTAFFNENPAGGSVVTVEGPVRPKLQSTLNEIREMRHVDAELRTNGALANGNGSTADDCAELEDELERIYAQPRRAPRVPRLEGPRLADPRLSTSRRR